MNKKYIVRLTVEERRQLLEIIKRQDGSAEKIRRAHILLMADANGDNWVDTLIAKAYHCSCKTVADIRERFVTRGFEETINAKKRSAPPRIYISGEQEAQIIAVRTSTPPKGYRKWTLQLLADRVVELGIVESITPQTISRKLKKTK